MPTQQSKTHLQEQSFTYQLATPIETEIESIGSINGYPNGTFYIDNIVTASGIYKGQMNVVNSDYPIKSIEKIYKISSTGSQTEVPVTGSTILSGGLGFTHTSLVDNDIVWFTYIPTNQSFKSTNTVTYSAGLNLERFQEEWITSYFT